MHITLAMMKNGKKPFIPSYGSILVQITGHGKGTTHCYSYCADVIITNIFNYHHQHVS